ncbi:MAG: ATP-binding protein [Anaerolineaceae bacterium]
MLPDYRVRQRDYLLEISRAMTEELDLDALLLRILRVAVEMLTGHAGFIALVDEHKGWHITVNEGIPQPLLNYIERWLESLPVSDDQNEVHIPEINRMLNDISMGMISGVGIMMIFQKKIIGQIYVFRNYRGSFSTNDRILLGSFANQAAIAVRNARLYNETREQSLRLGALLDSVADGILILTPQLVVERVNKSLERLLNTTEANCVGKPFQQVLRWTKPPQGTPLSEVVANIWPAATQDHFYIEGDLERKGLREPLPVGITYGPLFSQQGKLLNVIASVRDITRFRTAEEMQTSFISVVSHELKTPIALIKGYVSTLRRDDVQWDRDVIAESLQVIEEETDHLTDMVDDLLDATRLQAGGFTLKKAEISIPEIANYLVPRFSTQTTAHTITVNFPKDYPTVVADEERIRQVLSNLIGNSIKYTPGGEILISGKVRPKDIVVCVSDQGKGIDPRDISLVFDRFYRSEEAAKTTKGTGLGLYLCKEIIKAHGGKIWVDETYKEGSRMCFSLPRNPDFPSP